MSGPAERLAITVLLAIVIGSGCTCARNDADVSISVIGPGKVATADGAQTCGPDAECRWRVATGTARAALIATPETGARFDGYGGDCTGQDCALRAGSQRIVATFSSTPPSADLTVVREGPGEGVISSADGRIHCGTACRASFNQGDRVVLTAEPDLGSEFIGWSPPCGTDARCELTIVDSVTLTAAFAVLERRLHLSFEGDGSGQVTFDVGTPAVCGTSCEWSGTEPSVLLSAMADPGTQFVSWGGACAGQGEQCTVTPAPAVDAGVVVRFERIVDGALALGPPGAAFVVSSDGDGGYSVGGVYAGPFDAGIAQLVPPDVGNDRCFLMGFTSGVDPRWILPCTGDGGHGIYGVTAADARTYAVISNRGELSLGGFQIVDDVGTHGLAIARIGPDGGADRLLHLAGASTHSAGPISILGDGSLAFAGRYSGGPVMFGPMTLPDSADGGGNYIGVLEDDLTPRVPGPSSAASRWVRHLSPSRTGGFDSRRACPPLRFPAGRKRSLVLAQRSSTISMADALEPSPRRTAEPRP